MTEKRRGPKVEDEAQSQRFIETARELEADGELSPTALERVLGKVAPPKTPSPPRQE